VKYKNITIELSSARAVIEWLQSKLTIKPGLIKSSLLLNSPAILKEKKK